MQVTFDSVIGTFFGIFVRTILDLIFEKFSGKDFSKYIQANVRKKLSRDMELEINRILQTVLRSNEYSLDRLKRDGAEIALLPTATEFFDEKKRMVESLDKEDVYILVVGRPFFHLLPQEREQLATQLSPSAKAYLDTLNAHLESGIGHFTYFVDPFATVEQMLSKIQFSFKDVATANDLLLQKIAQHGERLKMYAAPPSAFGLDCILVNTTAIPHQIVFGHRPLGRSSFEIGVRIRSKRLYEHLIAFFNAYKRRCEIDEERGYDLKYYLEDALRRSYQEQLH